LHTAGRFAKKNFEFRRLQKITDNSNLLLALQGQMASKNLMSAEKFSLGGPGGVRAYPTGEGLGDYWATSSRRNTATSCRASKIAGGDLSLSGSRTRAGCRSTRNALAPTGNPVADNNNRNLSGYGVGASLGKDSDFVVRMMAAWRNENEAPQSDTRSAFRASGCRRLSGSKGAACNSCAFVKFLTVCGRADD
jgi:hemolysin activation/secretion protein